MRIKQFELCRYGHFTDQKLDFGSHRKGMPDIHIIYGANEAGKSTLLNAWLDLLFGIENQTRFAFRHHYDHLMIRAVMEKNHGCFDLTRIKGKKNTLRDAGNNPYPDNFLAPFTGGLDRTACHTMFSLNRKSLEEGSESILQSEGELGKLLFSAGSGLTSLNRTLTSLRKRNSEFFNPHGRKYQLNTLIDEVKSIKAEIRERDLDVSQFQLLSERVKKAEEDYRRIREERDEKNRNLISLKNRQSALKDWKRCQHITEELEGIPAGCLPPEAQLWETEIPKMLEQEGALKESIRNMEKRISSLQDNLESLTINEKALELADHFQKLDESHAREITALNDLPKRIQTLERKNTEIERLLQRIGRSGEEDAGTLLLHTGITAQLRLLSTESIKIQERLEAARQEYDNIQEEIRQNHSEEQQNITLSGENTIALTRLLEEMQHSSLPVQIADIARKLDDLSAEQQEDLEKLKWAESVENLKNLDCPDELTLEQWIADLDDLKRKETDIQNEITGFNDKLLRINAALEADRQMSSLPTPRQLTMLRMKRTEIWQLHKEKLTLETAESFETILKQDDEANALSLNLARDYADRLSQEKEKLSLNLQLQHKQKAIRDLKEKYQNKLEDIRQILLFSDNLFENSNDLKKFIKWIKLRQDILERDSRKKKVQNELERLHKDRNRILDDLEKIFLESDIPLPAQKNWQNYRSRAEDRLKHHKTHLSLQEQQDNLYRNCEKRRKIYETSLEQQKIWERNWENLQRQSWLCDKNTEKPLSPAEIQEILDQILPKLDLLLNEKQELEHRIQEMEHDRQLFSRSVSALACELDLPAEGMQPTDLWIKLEEAIRQAQNAESQKKTCLEELLQEEEALSGSRKSHEEMLRKKDIITGNLAVPLEQALSRLSGLKRRQELEQEKNRLIRDILSVTNQKDADLLPDILDNLPKDRLEADIITLNDEIEHLNQALQEAFAVLRSARNDLEAVSADSATIEAQTRLQTLKLEIEERAKTYFKQAAGILAAERALDIYREEHRSTMMQQASRYFTDMTLGTYDKLTTRPDERKGDILIALNRDGSKKVSELSDGTRFQLYLALRLAGYGEFTRTHEAFPFIADDILEPSDEERSFEIFRILGSVAQTGQVIYLTHQRHLLALAQKAVPEVQIHHLKGG